MSPLRRLKILGLFVFTISPMLVTLAAIIAWGNMQSPWPTVISTLSFPILILSWVFEPAKHLNRLARIDRNASKADS